MHIRGGVTGYRGSLSATEKEDVCANTRALEEKMDPDTGLGKGGRTHKPRKRGG